MGIFSRPSDRDMTPKDRARVETSRAARVGSELFFRHIHEVNPAKAPGPQVEADKLSGGDGHRKH